MNVKEKVSSILKTVFDEYKDQGVKAIYMWGSIVADHYNPQSSDVDAVAIVDGDPTYYKTIAATYQ